MRREQEWIVESVPLIDTDLSAFGVGSEGQSNLFSIVGFERRDGPRSLLVNGELLGGATGFAAAAADFETSGGTEDGWEAINFALNANPRRQQCVEHHFCIRRRPRYS